MMLNTILKGTKTYFVEHTTELHAANMSRLYRSLEWYTRVYTTRDYGITCLFHDRCTRANMSQEKRDKLFTFQWQWVMGRYLTPDTVLRDRRQK